HNTDLDRDLELFFFISVLRGVYSGYKVSLPIRLKFSDGVGETSVGSLRHCSAIDIGNISLEMVLCIICCWRSRSSHISSTRCSLIWKSLIILYLGTLF